MENASRALLISAGVLLGVMIITVAVALFRSFGGSGARIMDSIEEAKIQEFNNQFTKYYSMDYITPHDVVTLANLASANNNQYEVQDQSGKSERSLYVQINILSMTSNLEKKDKKYLTDFIQNNTLSDGALNKFKIVKIKTSSLTKRVNYVEIKKIS